MPLQLLLRRSAPSAAFYIKQALIIRLSRIISLSHRWISYITAALRTTSLPVLCTGFRFKEYTENTSVLCKIENSEMKLPAASSGASWMFV
jgi:hypothetical protein